MRRLFLACSLLLFAGAASADEEYDRCIGESDGSNQAWAKCGHDWIAREDAKLNETWLRLLQGKTGKTAEDLRAEQRAWNAFKELSCQFYANGEYGREGQVLEFPACRARVIARRTAELDAYESSGRGQ